MEVNRSRFDTRFWVEDTDRRLFDLQEMVYSLAGTKLITELSHYIIIEARVFRFRFQPSPWKIWPRRILTVCPCDCHCDSLHEGDLSFDNRWGDAIFFEQPQEENQLYHRMITEIWGCVLLFESTKGIRNLLIIEWDGDVAHQIGILSLRDTTDKLSDLPRKRQTIRLA